MKRALLAGASLAIVLAACGGGSMTETEYVEALNDLVVDAGSDLEGVLVAYQQIEDPSLDDFVAFVERQLAGEYEVREFFDELDPPASIVEVNKVMVDALARILAAAEGVLEAADTVDSLEALEQTPAFATYETVNADADSMCLDVQARINALSDRLVIDDPWIPNLRLTVQAFLGCTEVQPG